MREPLLHFMLIGLGLFALREGWRSRTAEEKEAERVEVNAAEVEWLGKSFQSRWLRPPTAEELRGLVDDSVRREVLYREALNLGLDRNDEVIQRRLVQKLEFMTEDLAAQAQPTEAELLAFFQENLDDYRIPEQRGFEQVYFNLDRDGNAAAAAAEKLLATLRGPDGQALDTSQLGDRFLLEVDPRPMYATEISRLFGGEFAKSLFELEPGEWQGPILSGFGLHLARVTEVVEGLAPELDAVRRSVLRDHAVTVRERARQAMYSSLATRYEIVIDEEAIRSQSLADPTPRVEGEER